MFSVALIGGDGAGKTTVANAAIQSCGLPMKYVYMGLSTRSSNHALPSSRLVLSFKRWLYKRETRKSTEPLPHDIPASQLEYRENTHGWAWNTARFLNRMLEAWYRQYISILYQLRGYVVIYDRHFFFDSAPGVINSQNQSLLLFDRLFFWFMTHVYPRPTLTIFLDAPSELLFQRKGEATPEYLEQQRVAFLSQGGKLPHFVQVDASQPFEKVLSEVVQQIRVLYAIRYPGRPSLSQGRKLQGK